MYDYNVLKNEIEMLSPVATEVTSVGKTAMGREIYCLKTGRGEKKLVVTGAHHGLEYITACFLMKFVREYNSALMNGGILLDRDAVDLFTDVTLYILPMVNPDGVDIAVNGLDITNPVHRKLISLVGIHSFRKVWQANAAGVDLNHNYDALWQNTVTNPSPTLYGGKYPESEAETAAVCGFLRGVKADMLICFHSQGREIYYDFDGTVEKRSELIAKKMGDVSGYTLGKPTGTASYGGCKDWFIKEFGNPGFTVEMAIGKNPIPVEQINEIYEENAKIILAGISELSGT